MYENPPWPNICVLEPLILKCFPTFVSYLPLLEQANGRVRYDHALNLKIVWVNAGALAADYYWT